MRAPPPQPSLARSLFSSAANLILGRILWLIGAPLLVIGCGLLLLWWSLLHESDALTRLQARSTIPVQARLVDRYYLVHAVDTNTLRSPESCRDTCQIEMDSIAVFEFSRADGQSQRVQFGTWAHDWQHNTDFELGLPLLAADFLIDPALLSRLQAQRSYSDSSRTIWELFWTPVDDAGHWLLRLRDPVPSIVAPLRYDPAEPSTALLDLPRFARAQARDREGLRVQVVSVLFIGGAFSLIVLYQALQLMLLGAPRTLVAAVTVAICLGLPWWAPHAMRIAAWLSPEASELAEGLAHEFAQRAPPNYVSEPVTDLRGLRRLRWELQDSAQAAFLAGLDTRLPAGIDALDHAAAYDALQASFDQQLRAMSPTAVAAVLAQLNHHAAVRVWELFVPALLRIAGDAAAPAEQRAQANDLLSYFASDWTMPDVDVFLYRHRLDNYARLREAPDPGVRSLAATRLDEANARVTHQLGTY